AERRGGKGVTAMGGGGARDVVGRGDERSTAAAEDFAVRLPGAAGLAAAGGSASGCQPATSHIPPSMTPRQPFVACNKRLLMQLRCGWGCLTEGDPGELALSYHARPPSA